MATGYHVTTTANARKIRKQGITKFHPSNWVKGSGVRYGNGEVFAFDTFTDALRWAGKMEWMVFQETGGGKISIVEFTTDWATWIEDDADPISHAGAVGTWYKRHAPVQPSDILGAMPVTTTMLREMISAQRAAITLAAMQAITLASARQIA